MLLVTVKVCGLETPEMAVTVICSPLMLMSNGKSAGNVAVVVHSGPVDPTDSDVAPDVAELARVEVSESIRSGYVPVSIEATCHGCSGEQFSTTVHDTVSSVADQPSTSSRKLSGGAWVATRSTLLMSVRNGGGC